MANAADDVIREYYDEVAVTVYARLRPEGEEVANAGVVMVMGRVTQHVRTLANVTGLPLKTVKELVERARAFKIFKSNCVVDSDFFSETVGSDHRNVALAADAAVMMGMLDRECHGRDWKYCVA